MQNANDNNMINNFNNFNINNDINNNDNNDDNNNDNRLYSEIRSDIVKKFKMYKRRIINEIPELLLHKKNVNINFSDNQIELSNLYKTINIQVIINDTYPWKPPPIQLNSILYSEYIKSNLISDTHICLHCESITNKQKWSPSIKVIALFNEIEKFIDYKQYMINMILVKKIKNNFLVDDIPLETYFHYEK